MLKIAVASEKGKVAGHFGHCPEFIMFTSENGKITAEETVKNPGHRKGFLPDFLEAWGSRRLIFLIRKISK